jgi:hypothetical protein
MRAVIWLCAMLTLILPSIADATHRTHVRIHKQPPVPSVQPVVVPFLVVPPIAMAVDLVRRTSCDPALAVASGPNDPGFTSLPPGNYLLPAIYTSRCPAPEQHR